MTEDTTDAAAEPRAGAPQADRGEAAPQATDGARSGRSGTKSGRPTRIELEVSRQRSIGWTIFGLLLGALLINGLGTVGVWAGVALVAMGLYHAWQLIRTLLHPPGTIVVSDDEVVLPRGLCTPRPVVVAPKDVTAAYFLRRTVPWNHAAPVLVIELGDKAMVFPRDWFASEADQRHVIHAVLRSKGEAPAAQRTAAPDGPSSPA